MKKILVLALAICASAAFANGERGQGQQGANAAQKQKQKTEVVSTSAAQSAAQGGEQQQQQGIQEAGNSNVTVGCLVNCAENPGRDLTDLAIANINAEAAKAIADKNGETARAVAGTTQTIKNTPSIATAALTSSNDTCMGSVSVGGSGPGFSLGIGTTYKDDNCVMLKNSRELWNMGMKGAAMALMCTDKANREALELTGYECPQTTAAKKAEADRAAAAKQAAAPAQAGKAEKLAAAYEGNDPIVQARLGLK